MNDADLLALCGERDAEQAELQDFLYAVSHDLRAPLRHILAYAQVMREDCPDLPEPAPAHLAVIERAARTLQGQIDGLTRLSRLGVRPLAVQPLSLGDSVRDALDAWRAQADLGAPAALALHTDGLDAQARVCADPTLLAEVWAALLDNARKALRDAAAPTLDVHLRPTSGGWVLTLCDNGLGFDADHAAALFKPFGKLHPARHFDGLGLGLVWSRKALALMGGVITLTPGSPAGCQVSVTLPG